MVRNPLAAEASTLIKVGSALVHALEFIGPSPAPEDKAALDRLLEDPEMSDWLVAMSERALLPVPRTPLW